MSLKYLYQMFPDENKRRRFIINCALTFGLRAETLAALLNTSVETIKSELLYNISYMHNSMQALFHIGMNNQEEAKQNFIEFFNKLVTAGKSNNKEEISNVLATISDRKAMQIMRREGRGTSKLSDEQILAILKYQIKYMLETKSIARIFNIDRGTYSSRVRNLGPEYANLISDFDYLSDFYHNASLASRGIK